MTHLEVCILRRKRLTLTGHIALMPERITKDGEWKRERDGSIRTGGEEINERECRRKYYVVYKQPSCNGLTLLMFTITVVFSLLCTNFYILQEIGLLYHIREAERQPL